MQFHRAIQEPDTQEVRKAVTVKVLLFSAGAGWLDRKRHLTHVRVISLQNSENASQPDRSRESAIDAELE
jgi:hypothetical protein